MRPHLKSAVILVLIELLRVAICKQVALATNCCLQAQRSGGENETQLSRVTREAETGRGMIDYDHHDADEPKAQKPWLGYYDFLITEGSYKFWVVFQLFTIAVLIYSAFAAIYYAKYTINDYENYDDYFFGRSARSARSVPPAQTAFLGLPVQTYLRIFNAIASYGNKLNSI